MLISGRNTVKNSLKPNTVALIYDDNVTECLTRNWEFIPDVFYLGDIMFM